jgi:hypothetical protein
VPTGLRLIGMTTPDTRIVLRVHRGGELNELIVDHPGQPADYVHTDGTVWTWLERWTLVGGVRHKSGLGVVGADHLRVYDLVGPGNDSGGTA